MSAVLQSSRARTGRPPSVRDREIFRQVKVCCRRQNEVAAEVGRSPGQVSRIVKRVGAWRAAQPRDEQGELSHVEQRRLSRWLAQQRAEELYAESRRLVDETMGKETGDGKQGTGESQPAEVRLMALRLQAIKTALKASQESYELCQADPPPEPDPAQDEERRMRVVVGELMQRRETAEEAGQVPKSRCVWTLIDGLLKVLVGENLGRAPPGARGPGSGYWELAQALVGSDGPLRAATGGAAPAQAAGLPPSADEDQQIAAALARYQQLSADPTPACAGAQERNCEAPGNCHAAGVAQSNASAGEGTTCDHHPAADPAAVAAEEARKKAEKLRAEVVGSPEWQVARAAVLREREQRRIDEAYRKCAEQLAREVECEERRQRARIRAAAYTPPLDLGYQPPPRAAAT